MKTREYEIKNIVRYFKSELDEMSKPKNSSEKAKSHFKRKPYSKDKLIID